MSPESDRQLKLDFSDEGELRRNLRAARFRRLQIEIVVFLWRRGSYRDGWYAAGPFSHEELGRATNRSKSTVSDSLRPLIARGALEVRDIGKGRYYRFCKARLLRQSVDSEPGQAPADVDPHEAFSVDRSVDRSVAAAPPYSRSFTEGEGERERKKEDLKNSLSLSLSLNPGSALESYLRGSLAAFVETAWHEPEGMAGRVLIHWEAAMLDRGSLSRPLEDGERQALLGAFLGARNYDREHPDNRVKLPDEFVRVALRRGVRLPWIAAAKKQLADPVVIGLIETRIPSAARTAP